MRRPALTASLLALVAFAVASPVTDAAPKKTAAPAKTAPGRALEPKDFDRLDGKGATAKKVDVIEWEGNLEIHVYPKGSLKSLGLKIDSESQTTKNKVMVIEYGFHGVAYTLIRRAILSIPMPESFKAFRDETASDYDKIIVSANQIAGARPYALAPTPTQLYPDYHPALAQGETVDEARAAPGSAGEPAKTYQRRNASAPVVETGDDSPGIQFKKAEELEQDSRGTTRRRRKSAPSDEDGGIRNFAF